MESRVDMIEAQRDRLAALTTAYAVADAKFRASNRALVEHDEKLAPIQRAQAVASRERTEARDALLTFLEELGDERIADIVFYSFVTFVVLLLIGGVLRDNDMYAKCIADGHKDYECAAMLRGRR